MTSKRRARGEEAPPVQLRFPLCTPGNGDNLPVLFTTTDPGNQILDETFLAISEQDADVLLQRYNDAYSIGNGNAIYLSDYERVITSPEKPSTSERIADQVNEKFSQLLRLWIERDFEMAGRDSIAVANGFVTDAKTQTINWDKFETWLAEQIKEKDEQKSSGARATARRGKPWPTLIKLIFTHWQNADSSAMLKLSDSILDQKAPTTGDINAREAFEWFKILSDFSYWRPLVILNALVRVPALDIGDLRASMEEELAGLNEDMAGLGLGGGGGAGGSQARASTTAKTVAA
jgi:hypothetical protein